MINLICSKPQTRGGGIIFITETKKNRLLHWYISNWSCWLSGQIDNIDFYFFSSVCQSHLTGEDWWRQIRRFQQPIPARPSGLSIISPRPMVSSAAGLKSCLLSRAVKGLKKKFTTVKSSGSLIENNRKQRHLSHSTEDGLKTVSTVTVHPRLCIKWVSLTFIKPG